MEGPSNRDGWTRVTTGAGYRVTAVSWVHLLELAPPVALRPGVRLTLFVLWGNMGVGPRDCLRDLGCLRF